MYPLVPESLMAVWSDSKVAETAHVFGRPCSLWDCEEIIYDRGNNGRWIWGGPIREAAETVGIRIMNITVLGVYLLVYDLVYDRVYDLVYLLVFTHD
jgi:hypothetical protein